MSSRNLEGKAFWQVLDNEKNSNDSTAMPTGNRTEKRKGEEEMARVCGGQSVAPEIGEATGLIPMPDGRKRHVSHAGKSLP